MINNALFRFLSDEGTKKQNIDWLFGLRADIGHGDLRAVSELCGFRWQSGEPDLVFDKGLKLKEWKAGGDESQFNSMYLSLRPDFRFCTKHMSRRLFIEGKGGGPSRDSKRQASTYLRFISESGSTGALIYLVPKSACTWATFLQEAKPLGVETGVLYWDDDAFLARLSTELLHVITESLIGPMKLLEKALKFRDRKVAP
jgi:hypothetical protein